MHSLFDESGQSIDAADSSRTGFIRPVLNPSLLPTLIGQVLELLLLFHGTDTVMAE